MTAAHTLQKHRRKTLQEVGEHSPHSVVGVNNFAHPIHKLYSHMENFHMVKARRIGSALFVVD